MAFKGAVGVSIVIVSLFASAILGVLINVNQTDVLKDVDHYQSDITGLYKSDKDKSYAEYNTAKNFNGYTSTDTSTFPVDFKESNVANNYPFSYYSTSTVPKTISLTAYTSTTVSDKYSIYNDFKQNQNAPYFTGWQSSESSYQRISLWDFIQTEMNYATTQYGSAPDSLTITLPFSIKSTTGPQSSATVYYPDNWATFIPNTMIGTNTMQSMVDSGTLPSEWYRYSALSTGGLRNIECTYDASTNLCSFNFGTWASTGIDPTAYSIAYVSGGNFTGTYYTPPSGSGPGVVGSGTQADPYTYINMNAIESTNYFSTTKYVKIGSSVTITHIDDWPEYWSIESYDAGFGLSENSSGDLVGNVSGTSGSTFHFQISFWNDEAGDGSTFYRSFILAEGLPPFETITAPASTNNVTVEYNYSKVVKYMDPREGISARPQDTVTWSNDYSNGMMDITVYIPSVDSAYYNRWDFIYSPTLPTPPATVTYADKNSMEIDHIANGNTTFTLTSYQGATPVISSVSVGKDWNGFNIHIDATTGKVTAQLIAQSDWTNFQNWTGSSLVDIGTFAMTGDIDYMQVYGNTSKQPFKFQITSTSVFLNTYGVILIDSSVNILNWYPNNDHFKMKFSKMSAVGSSVLLGNVLYTITNEQITIDNKKIDVKDMVLEYERNNDGWLMTVSSEKTGKSAERQVTDTNVGLNGAWFFTCEYYTVTEEWVKENVWEPIKGVAYGLSGIILIMLALNIIFGIIVWKAMPGLMEIPDIVILIGAEIILFVILT